MTVKTVACLAGDGVGPELMAAATRALESVTRLHAFELDDVHLPFAGEAVTRSGHPLPPETRAGYRNADAILVASPDEPAFDGVKADLALAWRVARVHVEPVGDIVIAGPMGSWANSIALARAFACAASRHGRVVTVGDSKDVARRRRARAPALGRARGRGAPARRHARPSARAAGEPRRRRHRGRPRLAGHRCSRHVRRLRRLGRARLAVRGRPRRVRAAHVGAVRARGLRRRRSDGHAPDRVADAGRGAEAPRCLEDARAGRRPGRRARRGRPRTTRARSPTR